MLALERRLEEIICIGDDIEIQIIRVRNGGKDVRVKLGITAPRHIPVNRKEVHEAIKREKRAAEK